MNAPFSIGQKVVYLGATAGISAKTHKLKKGDVGIVDEVEFSNIYLRGNKKTWYIGVNIDPDNVYLAKDFAPIQTNYADATAEILEKFKPTEDTPDKIIIPEKLKSIL